MPWKKILLFVVVPLLGIGIMVGVVLFLRARNAPSENGSLQLQTGSTTRPPPTGAASESEGIPPFTPYDQIPKAEPSYKPGEPIPEDAPPPEQPPFTEPSTIQP